MSYNYCANPVEQYVNDVLCGVQYEGGGKHIVFFLDGLPEDPSDGAEIQEMIDDGRARIVKNVKVGLPAPSAQESTSLVACQPPSVATYDRTVTITDGTVSPENVLFWNSLNASNGTAVDGAMIYECSADRVTYINKPIAFRGGRIFPDNNDSELQRFEYTGNFKSKGDPTIHVIPADVFD